MISRTFEGIDLQPIYSPWDPMDATPWEQAFPGADPFRRGAELVCRGWDIAQDLPYPTCEEFSDALRNDMERGQTAVQLTIDAAGQSGKDPDEVPAGLVGREGVSIFSMPGLSKALEGVPLQEIRLIINAGAASVPYAALLCALARKKGVDLGRVRFVVGFDPLGNLVREGSLPLPLEGAYREMAAITAWAHLHAKGLKTIAVYSQPYHNGGANAVEELGYAIATGATYLRELQRRGVAPDIAAGHVWFSFSLSPMFFMEVAKLRAARLLWSAVVEAFGGAEDARRMEMHVRTSRFSATALDPYVNMLRGTTESLSGAIGGCTTMHVAPFDEVIRLPDEFSRRIARNAQIIIQSEAHIDAVLDPAGGSWYVESLTDELAGKAWELFQEVERAGGMGKAVLEGHPQARVASTATRKLESVTHRRSAIVGVSVYANPDEVHLADRLVDHSQVHHHQAAALHELRSSADHQVVTGVLAGSLDVPGDMLIEALVEAALRGATVGEMSRTLRSNAGPSAVAPPVPEARLSAPFEALRNAARRYHETYGEQPAAFLAAMGPLSQHKARADFACGFFAVGGFRVISPKGFSSPDEAVRAAAASHAPVVVICSTDETYPVLVPVLTSRLKEVIPGVAVVLAGYPAEHVEKFRAAGIDEFVHVRANVVEVLQRLLARKGVSV
jgi:methylmalonyl-CoA mutase